MVNALLARKFTKSTQDYKDDEEYFILKKIKIPFRHDTFIGLFGDLEFCRLSSLRDAWNKMKNMKKKQKAAT